MTEQVIVTPEIAKRDVPEVREISASINAPVVNTGDDEAVDLYKSRETKRGEGDRLPENRHSQMRGTVLASEDMNTWFHPVAMSDYKLSPAECDQLAGLYES